jgi:hypothetical protein
MASSQQEILSEHALKVRLAERGIDTGTLAIQVLGSTVTLTGTVSGGNERDTILRFLFGVATVDRVIDSLRVGSEVSSTVIYMKNGEALARTISDAFNPELTWEQYRAAKKARHRLDEPE